VKLFSILALFLLVLLLMGAWVGLAARDLRMTQEWVRAEQAYFLQR
jgi:hypothetical protein